MLRTPFQPLAATELRTLTFPFLGALAVGETLSSAAMTVMVYSGTDATPSNVKSGSATVSGTNVLQNVAGNGGVVGVIYELRMVATTSLGNYITNVGYLAITPDLP